MTTPYLRYQRAAMQYMGKILRGEIPTDSKEELQPVAELRKAWLESEMEQAS